MTSKRSLVVGIVFAGLWGCSESAPSPKERATKSTEELKGAATPANFRLVGPSFENVAAVASPQPACPSGQMMVSLSAFGIVNRPLYQANGTVDTTPDLPWNNHLVSPNSVGGFDNNIVHLTDGTFLANVHGATWRSFTGTPPVWEDELVGDPAQPGARWALHFARSDSCGSNWQISTMMDMADVGGGIYAVPRPARRNPDGSLSADVSCADQTTENGNKNWWIGGGDRPELYACPYTGNVYLSFWGISGPYCPDPTSVQKFFGLLLMSRDRGQSWEFVTELPPSPPFVMTSTPDGRLFLFALTGGQPTLYVSTPTAALATPVFLVPPTPCGATTCGFPAAELDGMGTPIPNQVGSPVDHHHMEAHPSISRISTDRSSSKVRLAYHDRDPASGMQRARVVRAEILPEGGAPLIKPIALVSAQDPQDHSTLYFNFNDPDIITKPAATRSNTSMAYWVEAPRCRPGEDSWGRQCRNPTADSARCGAAGTAGTACTTGQVCSQSACVAACPSGQTACTAINSSALGCYDTQTHTRNCGACGITCNFGQVCSGGVCVAGNNKPAYGARHMFFEGDCRATTPKYISVTPTGADRTWEGTNQAIGDYVKGASWWNNGELNFLAHWSDPGNLMAATTVSAFGASQPDLHVFNANQPLSSFQAWDNTVRADGWQTVNVDSHVLQTGEIHVNGVWHHQTTSTSWVQGHTVADFETALGNFQSSGLRLEKLSSFVLNDGGVRVDATFEQNANIGSAWIQGYTAADFLTENSIRTGAGMVLDHLSSWVLADGGVRVNAVWHDGPGTWAFVQGYTVADFITEDTARRAAGWRIDELASFVLADGSVRVDALWHMGPEQSFWAQGHTVEHFRSLEADLRCDGWQLQKFSSFVLADGGVRVDGVWHRAGEEKPTALCQDVTVTAGASCTGSVTAEMIDNGSFSQSGTPPTLTLSSTGPFPRGTTQVTLTASSGGQSSQCTANVTVVDGTPPTITPPANVNVTQCLSSAPVTVGTATGTDNCGPPTITGAVISTNGVSVVPPTPVVGTQVPLGIGTHVIQWTASDGAQQNSAQQIVTVGPRIEAGQSFIVRDRARVTNAGGVLAAISNRGTGLTQVRFDARSGGIFSVGPVTVLDRATIGGNILGANSVSVSSTAIVNGSVTQFGSVVLPALPTLPAFPPATGGDITVHSGTQNRGPGSYNVATLNGGTLNLTASGDYFFRTLTINSASTIRVAANSRVLVQNQLAYRTPFRPLGSANTVQTVFLGFAGTSTVMEAPYNGTLVAPSAFVSFGVGAGLTFNGSFFASTIEVNPQSVLVCL